MKRISEKDLISPSLLAMQQNGGSITMSELISKLRSSLRPTGRNLAILDGRQDDHFSQIVRNLVSHRTLVKLGYAKYTKKNGAEGLLTLTIKGKAQVTGKITPTTPVREDLENEHLLVSEGYSTQRVMTAASRSQKLRTLAFKKHGNSCAACGLNFRKKYEALKRDCMELHHVVPISLGVRKSTINDLIPLCPNCHRVAHTKRPPLKVFEIRRMLKAT
jgi:5-methylcytosine-specific restriction endonuclease McrA